MKIITKKMKMKIWMMKIIQPSRRESKSILTSISDHLMSGKILKSGIMNSKMANRLNVWLLDQVGVQYTQILDILEYLVMMVFRSKLFVKEVPS
jgi:hypothetical protein